MKALVTGGGGFLGQYLVEHLLARGDQVRVISRDRHPELEALNVEAIQGDVRDVDALGKVCQGCDIVFHVAAVPGIWGSWKLFHSINTQGTINVIEACRQHNIGKLVYTSSPSVIFDDTPHENVNESHPYPQTWLAHYPHSKALAEQAVLAANEPGKLLTVALRPHLIWGPRDNHLIPRLIQRAAAGRLRIVGDGNNQISMSYVENVAAAHLQVADALSPESPVCGQVYFINEPEPVKLWDWVNELLGRAGLPPVKKRISATAARRVGAAMEGIYWIFRLPGEPPMTRFLASQLSHSHYYDISKAKQDFGYTPPVSVEEGMNRLEPELKRLALRTRTKHSS